MDLLGRYRPDTWAKRLAAYQRRPQTKATDTVRVHSRTAPRLSASQVAAALVDAYRAGETVYELAARFNIHRTTVSAHLHRQGPERGGDTGGA